eukprot:scaffold29670_cov21-Tisochrysis_lutea.AAC.1
MIKSEPNLWILTRACSMRVQTPAVLVGRKLILQCFSSENLKAILPIVRYAQCALLIASCKSTFSVTPCTYVAHTSWVERLDASKSHSGWQKAQSGSRAVDLEDWMLRCFLDIACEAGFGMPGTAVLEGPNEFLH